MPAQCSARIRFGRTTRDSRCSGRIPEHERGSTPRHSPRPRRSPSERGPEYRVRTGYADAGSRDRPTFAVRGPPVRDARGGIQCAEPLELGYAEPFREYGRNSAPSPRPSTPGREIQLSCAPLVLRLLHRPALDDKPARQDSARSQIRVGPPPRPTCELGQRAFFATNQHQHQKFGRRRFGLAHAIEHHDPAIRMAASAHRFSSAVASASGQSASTLSSCTRRPRPERIEEALAGNTRPVRNAGGVEHRS